MPPSHAPAALTVLDTDCRSLAPVAQALQDAAGQALQYVALVGNDGLGWLQTLGADNASPAWLRELQRQLPQVQGAGLHHLPLLPGRLSLTLGLGNHQACLQQLRLQADRVLVGHWHGDLAWAKALARCCRRGTTLQAPSDWSQESHAQQSLWHSAGFCPLATGSGAPLQWNPAWEVKTSREPWRAYAAAPGYCVVLGAGIAGAAVAAALARRGWQVQVLDRYAESAGGASGLPVGLAAPYATADDSPLARLTRHGVRLLQQQARALLAPGRDWAPSGVIERSSGDIPTEQWQPQACWVRPAALVQAWLQTPGVQFRPHSAVHSLQRDGADWQLRDAHNQVLAQGQRVVLANGAGAPAVLQHSTDAALASATRLWPATHTVRGLVSWGTHLQPETRPFPTVPLHGNGSLIAHVPFGDGERWFVGASYQPVNARDAEWPDDKNHGANALRLEKLAPDLFAALTPELEAGALQAWKGQRCVTADRMPLLGPVAPDLPGVWACAGFGSRGLSLVALCAELLAAQWAGAPWPVEASLAQALLPGRKKTAAGAGATVAP